LRQAHLKRYDTITEGDVVKLCETSTGECVEIRENVPANYIEFNKSEIQKWDTPSVKSYLKKIQVESVSVSFLGSYNVVIVYGQHKEVIHTAFFR